jgi:hypothetical protein
MPEQIIKPGSANSNRIKIENARPIEPPNIPDIIYSHPITM